MLGLVLALGGYTAAESTTQRHLALAEQSAVEAAAAERAAVAGERANAVGVARSTITDANAVQTVAGPHASASDLAVLTDAVDHLAALIGDVPSAATTTPAGGEARASRGVTREPLAAPEPSSVVADAPDDAAGDAASAPDIAAASADASADASAEASAVAAADAATAAAERAAAALAASEAAPAGAQAPLAVPAPGGPTAAAGDAFRAPKAAAAPLDELAAGIVAASVRVANLTVRLKTTSDQVVATAAEAAAAEAEAERVAAAEAAAEAQRLSLSAYANGRIPADALCAISFTPSQQMRCDAAAAFVALNASYRATFGNDLVVTDSYRSYSEQVACARTKGGLCATPGTSNHGRGVAVDLGDGIEVYSSAQHRWMAANAGAFGWILPDWASISGSKQEPWHWEFTD